MHIKEVSSYLFALMEKPLLEKGFSLDEKKKAFRRKTGDDECALEFAFSKSGKNILIQPIVAIYNEEICKIYTNATSRNPISVLSPNLYSVIKYYDDGVDVGIGCENTCCLVESNADVEKVASSMVTYFGEYALRYFSENKSLNKLNMILNKDPREISVHCWLYPVRAQLALIAAKLAKNPNYDSLVGIYQEEMAGANIQYKEDFEKLVKYLGEI